MNKQQFCKKFQAVVLDPTRSCFHPKQDKPPKTPPIAFNSTRIDFPTHTETSTDEEFFLEKKYRPPRQRYGESKRENDESGKLRVRRWFFRLEIAEFPAARRSLIWAVVETEFPFGFQVEAGRRRHCDVDASTDVSGVGIWCLKAAPLGRHSKRFCATSCSFPN
ncbi:hypothetical protein WA026_001321 [Henosepilachna vigintioctopunctata]|uniref:Uncharacterized protein n=1 Tax=Henosepilachna vigintioctopunctata TaxID=420089 RepID=A0AAW1UHY7_9CUCU